MTIMTPRLPFLGSKINIFLGGACPQTHLYTTMEIIPPPLISNPESAPGEGF